MRKNILTKHSTKQERIVYEVLKSLHIPFKHRWSIEGKEVDFLIGNVCLEIDGHAQDGERNHFLADRGYVPIHMHNSEVSRESIIELIYKLHALKLP